jgi:hypothetical protein
MIISPTWRRVGKNPRNWKSLARLSLADEVNELEKDAEHGQSN